MNNTIQSSLLLLENVAVLSHAELHSFEPYKLGDRAYKHSPRKLVNFWPHDPRQ